MLGYDDDKADAGLLGSRPRFSTFFLQPAAHRLAAVALLVVASLVLFSGGLSLTYLGLSAAAAPATWHGVSLGGWLVMEINPFVRHDGDALDMRPSWMFDQIEARSELDFVTALRSEHGDAYAIATMKNHWAGYISDKHLDAAQVPPPSPRPPHPQSPPPPPSHSDVSRLLYRPHAQPRPPTAARLHPSIHAAALPDWQALGVDTVRIPVGFWIMDAPVGGASPLEYGLSPEGFVTGGLNHLHEMLVKLRRRGMTALVDIHAHPCNSACVSDGLSCAVPLAYATTAAPIADMPRCGGGVYPTSRQPTPGEATWAEVGLNSIEKLAAWIAALPAEAQAVSAFQLANEPALGPPGIYEGAVNEFYARALPRARKVLPTLPLVLSFIPPTADVTAFLQKAQKDEPAPEALLADHHFYLNWQQPVGVTMGWDEIHRRACAAAADPQGLQVYTAAKQRVIIGEWSLALNHDAPLDLTRAETRAHLARFYKEQLEVFAATPDVGGAFFWTLRMGSGWDPRPSDAHPHGQQADGTSAWKSLPGYPFPVWSLLEMADAGVAAPLNASYAGTCKH